MRNKACELAATSAARQFSTVPLVLSLSNKRHHRTPISQPGNEFQEAH